MTEINTLTSPMIPVMSRIKQRRQETHDTFTVELALPREDPAFSFAPGQFNMLYVPGIGEVAISISGNPYATGQIIHTTRAVGTVTRAMSQLKPDDQIGIRGPFGKPWPVEACEGDDVIIIAGGIGLAPLRPVIYHILAARELYGKVILLYGTRSPRDILYRSELERWRARLDLEVFVTVDRSSTAWRGNVGVVTTLIPKAGFDPMHTSALICGPEIMMRYVAMGLQKRGVPNEKMYVSMERNMKCGVGLCGHCQFGAHFVCKDGPVYSYDKIRHLLVQREV